MGAAQSIDQMPESCVAHALSLTSPRDVCRAAPTSTTFRSAADADTVWDRFLPPDLPSILSRAADPAILTGFSSKKELYFRLCDHPLIIDAGKMSFQLERSSGRKCFMMSAREMVIIWGSSPKYWAWIPSTDSRFSEVAELRAVCWLEIRGKINARLLSPRTTYCAFLVFELAEGSYGLSAPAVAAINLGTYAAERQVCLEPPTERPSSSSGARRSSRQLLIQRDLVRGGGATNATEVVPLSDAEEGGWKKLELGEFFVEDGEEGVVDISLMEVKTGGWKKGLIVHGIEVRPKM